MQTQLITPVADNVTQLGVMEQRKSNKEKEKKFKYDAGVYNPKTMDVFNKTNILIGEVMKSI